MHVVRTPGQPGRILVWTNGAGTELNPEQACTLAAELLTAANANERHTPLERLRALVGANVSVTLVAGPDKTVSTGKLLSVTDSGEVALEHEDGFITWCWPALAVTPHTK